MDGFDFAPIKRFKTTFLAMINRRGGNNNKTNANRLITKNLKKLTCIN